MAIMNITIKSNLDRSRKILVEIDADKFERLAADLGLFSSGFLKSLERSDKDYKTGRIKKIKSLKEIK